MKEEFAIERACQVLEVSVSGFYSWRQRLKEPSDRVQTDERLQSQIRGIHEESRGTYGSPRIHRELRHRGYRHSRKRVARLMSQSQIRGRCRRRFKPRTTDSRHAEPIAPNRLQDRPAPKRLNEVWVTDITYLPVSSGWMYLAVVMDLCSRRVVGWCMQLELTASLVLGALRMALRHRQPESGLIVHSDRGVQFACQAFRGVIKRNGLEASMSRKANCYDNAAMESFFSSLKMELLYRQELQSPEQTARDVFEYIETFYNPYRLHSSLDYLSPAQFEIGLRPQAEAAFPDGDRAVSGPSEANHRSGTETCDGPPSGDVAGRELRN